MNPTTEILQLQLYGAAICGRCNEAFDASESERRELGVHALVLLLPGSFREAAAAAVF